MSVQRNRCPHPFVSLAPCGYFDDSYVLCSGRCFWFKSRLLPPVVTTLLCRESRELTGQLQRVIGTGIILD